MRKLDRLSGPVSATLTGLVIDTFFDVYNELGYGFLEQVYAGALHVLLHERGLHVDREVPFDARFRGQFVGRFRADMLVERCLVLELKAGENFPKNASAQLLNYLKLAHLDTGLVLFFGPVPAVKRVVGPRSVER